MSADDESTSDRNSTNRDPYRDNDDVRNPLGADERSGIRPDSKFEAQGDARENVGNHARGTDADASRPAGNDRTIGAPDRDEFDEDLDRDNRAR